MVIYFNFRKRKTNPLVDRAGNKLYRFGNKDLNNLWANQPDNLEACRDRRRLFCPDLYTHFQDAILELDPEEKVEEEYKYEHNILYAYIKSTLLPCSDITGP